ncbi:MAG TPA: hypothetical protein VGJ86_15100 [Acidimicrobiales bacterium]|jgi:lysophospholipase L1-like esterase
MRWQTIAAVVAAVVVVVAAVLVLNYDGQTPEVTANERLRAAPIATSTTTTVPSTTTEAPTTVPPTLPPTTETTLPPATEPPPPPTPTSGALCIGDSVMLGASNQYYGTLSMCDVVDAEVGRPMSAGAGVLSRHLPAPGLVVIHLGTNGNTSASEIDAMLSQIADVPRVLLVNVQVNGTRSWESGVNAELAAAAERWPNVRLVDWKAASDGIGGYFRDGIHITSSGAEAYANAIAAAAAS